MSYTVYIMQNGKWRITDSGINELYAESVAHYYQERGVAVKIEMEEE